MQIQIQEQANDETKMKTQKEIEKRRKKGKPIRFLGPILKFLNK